MESMSKLEKNRTTHEKIYLHTLPSIEMDTSTQQIGLLTQRKLAIMKNLQTQ